MISNYQTFKRASICLPLALLLGCQQAQLPRPSADSAATTTAANQTGANAKKQLANILAFPVYVDEKVPTLLHPIMPKAIAKQRNSYSVSKSHTPDHMGFFDSTEPFHYRAHIYNLVFENIATGETQTLFDHKNFIINDVYYPHITKDEDMVTKQVEQQGAATDLSVTKKQPKTTLFGHVIFHVQEHQKPADDDSKSNLHEQDALYMTDEFGKNRTKLHPDGEYVKETQWLPEVARYYFVTQTDSDNNGSINNTDKRKNYVIDFKQENPTAVAYDFSM